MSRRHLYPNATEPKPPRFNVGDLVYTKGYVAMPGYNGIDPNDTITINNLITAHGYTNQQVIHIPSIFGIIIDYQEPGTPILDCQSIGIHNEWRGVEDEHEECERDLPNSGSVWFLPDNERRYFVKWFNKEPFPWTEETTVFVPFMPLTLDNGLPVFNKSLYPEHWLFKAPDFLSIIRNKVAKRKEVEVVLSYRLNIDDISTNAITDIVSSY